MTAATASTLTAVPAWLTDLLAGGRDAAALEPGAAVVGLGGRTATAIGTATRGLSDKAALARELLRPDVLGVDLVHAAVNDLLAANVFARVATLVLGLADAAFDEAVTLGVLRGCRGHDVALAAIRCTAAPESQATLQLVGPVVQATRAPAAGDLLIGIASSGLHSDGHALAAELRGAGLQSRLADGSTLGQALLAMHKSYFGVLRSPILDGWPGAVVHIAEGGLRGSLQRALPDGLDAVVDLSAVAMPPVVARLLTPPSRLQELADTINLGVGMVVAVQPTRAQDLQSLLAAWNERAWVIGRVQRGTGRVVIEGGRR